MATHSSDLAWRIPGTAETDGLSSMGSQRVGHDRSDLAAAAESSKGFPGRSVVKNLSANANTEDTGNAGSIPELGGCPGGENGNLLQYSCLENSMGRGAWQAAVHGSAKSRT